MNKCNKNRKQSFMNIQPVNMSTAFTKGNGYVTPQFTLHITVSPPSLPWREMAVVVAQRLTWRRIHLNINFNMYGVDLT